jgi:hypothetical protein
MTDLEPEHQSRKGVRGRGRPRKYVGVTDWDRRKQQTLSGLPRPVYNALNARISSGDVVCEIRHRPAYVGLAYMLDEYGLVRPEFKGVYGGKLRAAKSKIEETPNSRIAKILYKRLLDHVKKNRARSTESVCKPDETSGRHKSIDDRCRAIFGFTLSEYMSDIEGKFSDGMTWEAVESGLIQIDHKIPVRIFNLSTVSGFRAAYALDNVVPIWRSENARKGVTSDKVWFELFGEGCING